MTVIGRCRPSFPFQQQRTKHHAQLLNGWPTEPVSDPGLYTPRLKRIRTRSPNQHHSKAKEDRQHRLAHDYPLANIKKKQTEACEYAPPNMRRTPPLLTLYTRCLPCLSTFRAPQDCLYNIRLKTEAIALELPKLQEPSLTQWNPAPQATALEAAVGSYLIYQASRCWTSDATGEGAPCLSICRKLR